MFVFEHATDPQEQRNTGTSFAGVAMEGGTHLYPYFISVRHAVFPSKTVPKEQKKDAVG